MGTANTGIESLLRSLADGSGSQRTESLPPECYRSEAFYEYEVERVFRRGWISVAHVAQIPLPGDYLCRDLLEEQLLITRDKSGQIHVLSRTCLHRWSEVVSGSGNAERLVCPFHAWTYELDGQLVGAPVTGEEQGFEVGRCRLHEFRHEIQDGFIFVNLGGEAPPLTPQVEPLHKRFKNYSLDKLEVLGSLEYECEYNWKILVETFMESYHHVRVHADNLELYYPARTTYADAGTEAYALLESPTRPEFIADLQSRCLLPVMEGLSENQLDRFVTYNH